MLHFFCLFLIQIVHLGMNCASESGTWVFNLFLYFVLFMINGHNPHRNVLLNARGNHPQCYFYSIWNVPKNWIKLNNKSHTRQATKKANSGRQHSVWLTRDFFVQKTDCWAFWAQLNELSLGKFSPAKDSLCKCFHQYWGTHINTVFNQPVLLGLFYWTWRKVFLKLLQTCVQYTASQICDSLDDEPLIRNTLYNFNIVSMRNYYQL